MSNEYRAILKESHEKEIENYLQRHPNATPDQAREATFEAAVAFAAEEMAVRSARRWNDVERILAEGEAEGREDPPA